ncbi:hypothetical protein CDD83_8727 [Cordyceps sp. RAO-2017]|nr:hypothetical protein CDD83_8727 [Cordyceps sp. RAO-2017]
MGLDYLFVHVFWTMPPALLMTAAYWPFLTRLEACKIAALIVIAVAASVPWDAHLVRRRIWSYPAGAVVGPTLFGIPLEEVFFFVVQTYGTSLLYVILTKRLVLPAYLPTARRRRAWLPALWMLAAAAGLGLGLLALRAGGRWTYTGLILTWACPVVLLELSVNGRFLQALPRTEIALAIGLPTLYLWLVDGLALRRGTWAIEHGTKLDLQIWGVLDVE